MANKANQGVKRSAALAVRSPVDTSKNVAVRKKGVTAVTAPADVGLAVRGSSKMQGDVRIKHREMISSVTLSNTAVFDYRVNPADGVTFPYLSALARMYDKYKFHSLSFMVVSGAASTVSGRWYLSWDPDSEDTPPLDAPSAMATRHSLSCTAWQTGSLSVPGHSDERYIAYKADSVKDNGRLTLLSNGAANAVDIYVEYDVTLVQPQNSIPTTIIPVVSLYTDGSISYLGGPETVFSTSPPAAKKLYIGPGRYLVTQNFSGTGIAIVSPSVVGGVLSNISNNGGTTSVTRVFCIFVDHNGATLTFNDTYTTVTKGTITLSAIDSVFYNYFTNNV